MKTSNIPPPRHEYASGPLRNLGCGILLAVLLILLVGCDSEGSEGHDEMVSRFGETESHNAGKNCMSCHRSGGGGEGSFVVAGTVYREDLTTVNPGTVIRLLSDPDRTLLRTIEVDARGNFYTTEALDFEGGLLAEVVSGGETRMMATPITGGACNSCHGDSVPRINIPPPAQ